MDLTTCDKLLTTTRSVRKRLDLTRPVDPAVLEHCIEIAIQAPTAGNQQAWHFMVVTDAEKRRAIAEVYRRGWQAYAGSGSGAVPERMKKVVDSASHLAEHFHEVPVHILACIKGRVEKQGVMAQASVYGSILPAVWSLMLALRARGLGSAWTTLHLFHEKEIAQLLGIPDDVTQAVLLPVGYYTGEDFQPAARIPAREVTSWNAWGTKRTI
ncbi:MAG: nitroreductase family protein [Candidatus Xenobia bacterium]